MHNGEVRIPPTHHARMAYHQAYGDTEYQVWNLIQQKCWKYEFQKLPSREGGAHQQYFDLYQKKSDTVSNHQYQMLPSHLPHASSEGTAIMNPNYIQSVVLFENRHQQQQLCLL